MLEINGKIVTRWVIRSCAQAAAFLRTELGFPLLPSKVPLSPPSQILPGESSGDKGMLGPFYGALCMHSVPGRARRIHATGETIHTPTLSVGPVLGHHFQPQGIKQDKTAGMAEPWQTLCPVPLSSTCLGVVLPPAPPTDFPPPQWHRHRCQADARHIPGWSCRPFCLRALKPQKRWGGGGGPGAVSA